MISVVDKVLILAGTLWVVAVGFVIFSWVLQARQQMVLRYIAARLEALEKKIAESAQHKIDSEPKKQPALPPETTIAIAKDEPLSKYEEVTLPDEIDINFIDRGA